jgi:hypothetical protein
LRHLGIEALAHLGAAVVDLDRPVGIDVQQRARLVEVGGGKADAEFHRGERQPFLENGTFRIEPRHGGLPLVIAGVAAQPGNQVGRDIVGHHHAIGRHIATRTIEIGHANGQRIAAEVARHGIHHPLDRQHPCGPPKPRKAVADTMLVFSRSDTISTSPRK